MRTDGMEASLSEVDDALEILIKAEEIKKKPFLMKEIFKQADIKKDRITSISDLKKAYDKLVSKNPKEEAKDAEESAMPTKAKVKAETDNEVHPADKAIEARMKDGK